MTPIRHQREGWWDRVKHSAPVALGILVGLAVVISGAMVLSVAPS